eukprot:g14636.t1
MNGAFGGNAQPQRVAQRPKALICYICGRQYGTNSLKIHLKSCIKIWEEREALKPKRERKPVPKAPAAFEQAINGRGGRGKSGMSAKQMQQQNEAAFNAFNSNSLDACPHCGRTFLAERLEKHLLSCKPGNIMGKKLKAGSGLAGGNLGGTAQSKQRENRRPQTTSPRHNAEKGANVKKYEASSDKPWRKHRNKASTTQDFVKKQHTSPKITVFGGKTNNAPRDGVKFHKFKSVSQGSEISPVDLEWSVIQDDNADVNNAASMEDRWERAIDLKTNRPYYFNTRTGKRRWTKPSANVSRKSTNEKQKGVDGIEKNGSKGSRAGSIWGSEEDQSMDSFFEKHDLTVGVSNSPRFTNEESSNSTNIESKPLVTRRERAREYRQKVKSTAEQGNLQSRVEELESKLSFALDEISRLNNIVRKFQDAFSNLNMSPRS